MGFLKKLTKPLSKFLDKIIPNEIKPALPYLSAFAPFMMGPTGIMGSSMLRRGLMSGALNIGSQLAQEGSEGDVDWLSAALAGGVGALSAPGSEKVMGVDKFGNEIIRPGSPSAAKFFETRAGGMDPGWMKSGTEMLGTGAEYLTGAGETLRDRPFSIPGMKAALVPATTGTADLARITAEQELKRLNDQEDETGIGINDDITRKSLRRAMEMAGHLEEDILSALDALGLRSGGIVGLKHGGQLVKRGPGRPGYAGWSPGAGRDKGGYQTGHPSHGGGGGWDPGAGGTQHIPKKKTVVTSGDGDQNQINQLMKNLNLKGIMESIPKINPEWLTKRQRYLGNEDDENIQLASVTDNFGDYLGQFGLSPNDMQIHTPEGPFYYPTYQSNFINQAKDGGRIGVASGGVANVLPKGKEADYRGGGVIPIGSRERADDVPARLSKNEFVMTADAVKAAGGGSVNRGAKKMYNLMHNLEARV